MEQQFRVGDIVTIADLAMLNNVHYGTNDEMIKMTGMQATIIRVITNNYPPHRTDEDGCLYNINIDSARWNWSNRMFVINPSSSPFKISDEDFE